MGVNERALLFLFLFLFVFFNRAFTCKERTVSVSSNFWGAGVCIKVLRLCMYCTYCKCTAANCIVRLYMGFYLCWLAAYLLVVVERMFSQI